MQNQHNISHINVHQKHIVFLLHHCFQHNRNLKFIEKKNIFAVTRNWAHFPLITNSVFCIYQKHISTYVHDNWFLYSKNLTLVKRKANFGVFVHGFEDYAFHPHWLNQCLCMNNSNPQKTETSNLYMDSCIWESLSSSSSSSSSGAETVAIISEIFIGACLAAYWKSTWSRFWAKMMEQFTYFKQKILRNKNTLGEKTPEDKWVFLYFLQMLPNFQCFPKTSE